MVGVTIRLVGSFAVVRDGAADAGLGSRKARRLLMLLAVHNDRTVPVDRIVDALWPDTPPRRPAENVATLVSRLRAQLGQNVIEGNRDGYRLGNAQVDVQEAARLVAEAERRLSTEPVLAATAASQALTLLKGELLTDEPDTDWITTARAQSDRLLKTARHVAATAALSTGEPRTTIDVANAAVTTDPWDETAHRLLMSAHAATGEPAQAIAVYETLRKRLAEELGTDPAPETQDLHVALLRGHPTKPPKNQPKPQPTTPTLVGREKELTTLTTAWTKAAAGQPSVLLIAGVPGIGKTTLAETAAKEAETTGGRILRTRCYAAERSLFLQPFVDALTKPLTTLPATELRQLAGTHTADLAALLPQLTPILGPPSTTERRSSESEVRRAFEAVTAVLTTLSANRPLLLILDDLHNAGTASIELLHYLARHLNSTRVLAIATIRAEEGAPALNALAHVTERLDLGPLDAAAVTALATAEGQAGLADTILRRTRGHTLFVVETLRGLRAGEATVPETLQTAVLAQVRLAGEATEELLRAGAVLGATVDPDVAAGMLGLPPHVAVQRCERAVSAGLLVVAGRRYEFSNDLVQEVLYRTSPEPLRVAHHRRAAELLSGAPESVGAHAAAIADWPRASRAFLVAGELAMRRHAAADAEVLLGRALDYATRAGAGELVARAHLARGHAREALGHFHDATGDHSAALDTAREAGDQRTEMLALRELGGLASLAIGAPVADCSARLHEGLRIAELLGDREIEAELLGWLAVIASNRMLFVDSLTFANRAVRAGRVSNSDTALAAALDGLKTAFAYVGELDRLDAVLVELEPLLRRIGDLELLQWAVFESAFSAIAAADWATATDRVEQALAVNHRSGHPLHESWFVAHLGWLARAQGQLDVAVRHGRHAVELAASLPHRWFLPMADALLGATLLEAGATDDAARVLAGARERVGHNGAEAHLLRCIAPLAEATGSPDILAEADALLASITTPPGKAWFLGTDAYLSVARAWLAQGEPERARTALRPLLTASRTGNWLPMEAQASIVDAQAAAALGDNATATTQFTRAAELGARYGMPGIERAALTLA